MLAVAVVFCRSAGAVAQLVERDIRIVEVRGSNPLSSTSPFLNAGGLRGRNLAPTHCPFG